MSFGLGTFADGSRAFAGLVVGDRVVEIEGATWELLQDWDRSLERLHALTDRDGVPLDSLSVRAPIAPSGQILCAGANYRRHLRQMHYAFERRHGNEAPEEELRAASAAYVEALATKGTPYVFAALPGALSGAYDDVVLFGPGQDHDWELELAVVIGRTAWRVPAERALEHVAGYTAGQDISDRKLQFADNPPQFSMGKSIDTFGPIGPTVVSIDAFGNPNDLAISCDIDSERVQEARTSDMIFAVPELIAFLSKSCTLEPGDLIFTGTPAGVGSTRDPRRYLKPGQTITTTIGGIGTLVNRCVD